MPSAIFQKRLKRREGVIDFFTLSLEGVAKDLERLMRDLIVADSESIPAIDAALARAQVQALLQQSGYYQVVGRLFDEGFQGILDGNFKDYQKLLPALQFSDVSVARLEALKSFSLNEFGAYGENITNAMQRILMNYSFGSQSREAALDALTEAVGDELGDPSALWVNQTISQFEQAITNQIGKDTGIEDFELVHPVDNLTRPWCLEHVGQVHTLEVWDSPENENGQLEPVSLNIGGWNCRGSLELVIPEGES